MAAPRRRKPVQARSKEMVERILHAATQVLATQGYGRMSTNHVADVAGVSVGSLYRYFSDKDEIFETLRLRASDAILQDLTGAIAQAVGQPPRVGVRAVVSALVAALQEHEPVVRALVNEVPLGTQANVLPEIERGLATFTRIYAAQQAPGVPAAEMDARIYLAMGVTLNSCLRIALEKPPELDADHLIDLVVGMLVLGLSP
ncbi:MAG: TetR/AcrR family transcriptional regulator [Propionibacteriales bacterium]|nr:TetR/AcrR family transcriptional regulator [Propionibacteriales bacterium]